jgi:hypothetical protein
MTIIATIRPGYRITTAAAVFTVAGSMKTRSGYKYICTDAAGRKISIDRADLIQAQRDGDATVTL